MNVNPISRPSSVNGVGQDKSIQESEDIPDVLKKEKVPSKSPEVERSKFEPERSDISDKATIASSTLGRLTMCINVLNKTAVRQQIRVAQEEIKLEIKDDERIKD